MRGGHNRKKSSTNICKALDILSIEREGRLTEEGKGRCLTTWINRATGEKMGNISLYTTPEYVRLSYAATDMDTGEKIICDYKVLIDWTPCNYGGKRAWYICTECGRRVRKLYLKDGYFLCRHCQKLNYYSQQVSKVDQRLDGIREKLYRVQDKFQIEHDVFNTYCAPKPKGMHQTTYIRLNRKMRELGNLYQKTYAMETNSRFGTTM